MTAVDAMQEVTKHTSWTTSEGTDIAVIAAFALCALVGGALTLRRRTP